MRWPVEVLVVVDGRVIWRAKDYAETNSESIEGFLATKELMTDAEWDGWDALVRAALEPGEEVAVNGSENETA